MQSKRYHIKNQLSAGDAGTFQSARISAFSPINTKETVTKGGAKITTNVTMGGYEALENGQMVRTGSRGALKIKTEKVNVPEQTTGGRRKIGIYTEKVNIPEQPTHDRRKIHIETQKVNVPTQPTGERRKIGIYTEKVNIPEQPTHDRRKIHIETQKVNVPKPVNEGRRVYKIEGSKK